MIDGPRSGTRFPIGRFHPQYEPNHGLPRRDHQRSDRKAACPLFPPTDDDDARATYRVIMEEQEYKVKSVTIGNPSIVEIE